MRLRHLALVCLAAALTLRATPLTITTTTTASGELGPGRFNNVPVTFTLVGDTTSVIAQGSGAYRLVQSQPTTVTVGTQGTYTLADFTYAFVQNGTAGIADDNTGLRSYADDVFFNTYSFTGATPSFTATVANTLQYAALNLSNGQNINFFSSGPTTFQAVSGTAVATSVTATPEPSSIALLGTGLAGLLGITLRRRA